MGKALSKKLTDKEAMGLALQQAEKGKGFVSPNPCVGCVILDKNRKLLSQGFYAHYGAIHAETMALRKIKNKKLLDQAYLFVTLEPCAHFGQNPPCVKELLKYPWKQIVYGTEDPNPKTKGKGIRQLKAKGFLVKKSSFFKQTIQRMYESFAFNIKEKRAFFALKVASSLDSVTALSHGESQWITSPKSRALAHDLRLGFDAVLIGLGTFLQDNPRLNIRKAGIKKTNKVIILDPEGQSLPLIPKSNLALVRSLKDIYVVTSKKAKTACSLISVKKSDILDLKALSYKLYEGKINSVLVEGGAETFSHFFSQKSAERLYQFINPSFLGGVMGHYWTENLKIKILKDRKTLNSLEILSVSPDLFLTGRLS